MSSGIESTVGRPGLRPNDPTLRTGEHREGEVARTIEQQTARIPSDWFLWAAVGAMTASLAFQMANKKQTSNFIGQWAPTLLILGLYNKLVKVAGSDRSDQGTRER